MRGKKLIKKKSARRWLSRNAYKIARWKDGLNWSWKSNFGRQILTCERSLRKGR